MRGRDGQLKYIDGFLEDELKDVMVTWQASMSLLSFPGWQSKSDARGVLGPCSAELSCLQVSLLL